MAKSNASNAAASADKPILGFKALLAGIVALVAVVALVFYLNSTSSFNPSLPYFPNLGSSVPQAFAQLPTYQGAQAASAISSGESLYLANVSQFSVNYAGSVYARGSGTAGLVSVSSPLYAGYSKYDNDELFFMNATSVSVLGDAEATYLDNANGTFVCSDFNISSNGSNIQGALFGSRNVTCNTGVQLAGIDLQKIAHFDFSQAQGLGVSMRYNNAYESSYKGMPCTYLNGTLEQIASNGTAIGLGAFGICVSDASYVPLSIAAYLSGNDGSFSVILNETSMSNSTTAAIAVLPGRLQS